MKTRVLGLLLIGLIAGVPAVASPVLEFSIPGGTGTISFSLTGPNAGRLVGTGIVVGEVFGIDTPGHSDTGHAVLGGFLSFVTGELVSYNYGSYVFAAGGSVTVSGVADLDDNGIGGSDSGTPLITGVFSEEVNVFTLTGKFKVASGAIFDTADDALTAYYGLGDVLSWDGGLQFQFEATQGFAGPVARPFNSTVVLSGGISNMPPPAIPEPGTLLLGISGLIGAFLLAPRRRRQDRKVS